MARYIDADALIRKIFPYSGVDKRTYPINAQAVYDAITKAPTEDVAPNTEVAWEIFEELDLVMERIRVYETVAPMSAYYQLVGCIESLKEKYKD